MPRNPEEESSGYKKGLHNILKLKAGYLSHWCICHFDVSFKMIPKLYFYFADGT